MRINYLKLENIRNLDSVELNDLKNQGIILITGPNGSGKSALFEAIRVFKSSLGNYSKQGGINLQSQYPDLITLGKDSASVTLEFILTDEEKKLLQIGKDTLRATVNIPPHASQGNPSGEDVNLLRRLFAQEFIDETKVGKIEHIPPDRNFSKGHVSSINFSQDFIEHDRRKMVDDTSAKFDTLKNDLLWMHFVDLQAKDKNLPLPQYIDGVRKIFNYFLDDVEFLGVDIDIQFRKIPQFQVKTPRGTHEIDGLSSGQKEIIMTYAIMEKRKFTNSIILFDEPDLHLHGSLERKVLSYIRGLVDQGNQFWIATHSPEIIGAVKNDYICRLTGGKPNTAEQVDLHSEKIQLLKQLGATHHIQMVSEKIVFVEGESDQEILEYLDPKLIHIASFVESGGVGHIVGVTDLLNRASNFDNFRALRDRDDVSDKEIEDIEKRGNNRIHVWRKREIENHLLDENIIFDVINEWKSVKTKNGVDLSTKKQVLVKLKEAADKTKHKVHARKIENFLQIQRVRLEPSDLNGSLEKAITNRGNLLELQDKSNQLDLINDIKASVDRKWNTSWKEICLGKEAIRYFVDENFVGSSRTLYPIFVENICKRMVETDRIPKEISEVIELIRRD